ncbi:DNA-3-methyladenine glycosylase family protein [Bailinhaonella thermotolerans]|uniref:DNA-3-methyladenine glycosylase 2 family protein n=1 Tax=Bailinhaonella thermotolerans TaxID=1070861 RepID=A0A3A4APK7_9ACTN|nr:DNA-3-methyladenine glycosylase [Bailinhaonella thermotolerans]RJL30489.1 DNA-3-methyladenine glycosylase 2 family protein [Bailinhaonella thermotolerans]
MTPQAATAGRARDWRPGGPLDVALTLDPHRHGGGDPTWGSTPDGALWRASLTPCGPGTLRLSVHPSEGRVHGRAWGPGAEWLLETMPALLGAEDDLAGFEPVDGPVREAHRRRPGLRLSRSGRVFEALAPAILEQKVVGREAWRAWRYLVRRYGTPAPGPGPEGLYVVPPPRAWIAIPSWEWHRAGAEAVRARTIITAARVADRLEAAPDSATLDRMLRSLPGIGVWTSAETRQRALGDPDAVSVGDYHLPSIVGWALTGRKADDAEMLRLLAPYAGHRHRAARLIALTGARPPARGPRMAARDYRRI